MPSGEDLNSSPPLNEVFFHNEMQFDHTIKRWEQEFAGSEACGSQSASAPLRIEVCCCCCLTCSIVCLKLFAILWRTCSVRCSAHTLLRKVSGCDQSAYMSRGGR